MVEVESRVLGMGVGRFGMVLLVVHFWGLVEFVRGDVVVERRGYLRRAPRQARMSGVPALL